MAEKALIDASFDHGVGPLSLSKTDLITKGRAALRNGTWAEARAFFEQALQREETPEAWEGLSWALWWLNDADAMFAARERAYSLYREQGNARGAARMAIWLAADHLDFRGELVIANGWRQRARRLLEGIAPSSEHGWLALHCGAFAVEIEHDPATALRFASEATKIGRMLRIIDLEILGLAIEGLALVSKGKIEEGMKRLDEAGTAASSGELEDIFSVTWAFCYLIYACERVRDYDRAGQWCLKMKEFSLRFNFRFTLGVCRAHYAGVLMWRGNWSEAEVELAEAAADLRASRPPQVVESIVRLAELRRRRGNFEEADHLFRQVEFHPLALLGLAELALDQEDALQARDLIERYVRHIPHDNKTQRAPALELLVRVFTTLQDNEQAAETLHTLESIAASVPTQPVRGSLCYARGILATALGERENARQQFEDAILHFEKSGAPFETARAHIELSKTLLTLGRKSSAEKEARAALALLQDIGAIGESRRAQSLLQTLEPARRGKVPIPGSDAALSQREVEVLRLVAQGFNDKEIAATLYLSEHTIHRHISNILTKLNVPSRAAAVAQVGRSGIL